MRITLAITSFILFIVCSCSNEKKKAPKTVLEGKKIDVSSLYKKRSADLVEALYEEIVDQSEELQELEKELAALKKQWPDSSGTFKRFNEKNNSYYSAAEKDLETIRDSVLRKKIKGLIADSRKNYTDSIASWTRLDSLVNKKIANIEDLHTLLKLVKTLPVIEDFQKNNLPPAQPGEEVIKNYDRLIQRLDSLSRIIKPDSNKSSASIAH